MEITKRIYNLYSKPILKFCVSHHITANQVTIFNHIMTLTLGCYLFSRGTYWAGVGALIVCLINGYLDYLDGDIAKTTKTQSQLGVWLDSGFDVIIQNAVLGAICIGCIKQGLDIYWGILFFVANASVSFVAFNYNAKFGFNSAEGNELFRKLMDKKPSAINYFLKGLIDPTDNPITLVCWTYRYYIVIGYLFNVMPLLLMVITAMTFEKLTIMYFIFARYLSEKRDLHVLKVLANLDETTEEYYRIRRKNE